MDAVAEDRMGVKGSIIDRMARHGGTATIRSAPSDGTGTTGDQDMNETSDQPSARGQPTSQVSREHRSIAAIRG